MNDDKTAAVRDLRILFETGTPGGLSDGQLLGRFVARREDVVFEAIVERHGPMVWGVCRRVLRDHHDAEDAFQATFLVLARKASSVAIRDKLCNWLYGVAYQTALKARTTRAKRQQRETQAAAAPEPIAAPDDIQDRMTDALDRELGRLPAKYRIPLVLCELEGMSHKEAASQLGWPIGTVSSRLSRARTMLARRLNRRGAALSAGPLSLLCVQDASAGLVSSTAQAASLYAAGKTVTARVVSAGVLTLTREMLKTMLLSRIKLGATLLLAMALTGTGLIGIAYRGSAAGQEKVDDAHRPPSQVRKAQDVRKSQDRGAGPSLGTAEITFGGGPDQPSYVQHGKFFFVMSPTGDRFSVYNTATNKASTIRLPGSKDAPLEVMPIIANGGFAFLWLTRRPDAKLPAIDNLFAFSFDDSKWYHQALKEPQADDAVPILGTSVAVLASGRYVYAFSNKARKWGVLEIPKDAPATTRPVVMPNSVTVAYDGHVHEFNDQTGEWKHIDLRALIDAAIKAAEEDEM